MTDYTSRYRETPLTNTLNGAKKQSPLRGSSSSKKMPKEMLKKKLPESVKDTPTVNLVAKSSFRRAAKDARKLYQELLMKEMPDDNRADGPQQAILESELNDGSPNVRNRALIHYLASLANSNRKDDAFDYQFVESLVRNGADINSTDKTGQTIFHEVARIWNTGVAMFLVKHGANVNQQDDFGRSPLHVAAAVDYAEMVEFLLQNGGDIAVKTTEEEQTPIHFAAKNDAVNSLKMLLGYGANIDTRDSKNRTPLQVAAQMNRSKAAKFLVSTGAPVGVHDIYGNCALSLLIEKIPDVALQALDQFYSADGINRTEYFFLNYLEGACLRQEKTKARTALDIAVQNERFDIILHPVMQRLIRLKWETYGKQGAIFELVINLLYAIVWTILGAKIPRYGRDLYMPLETHIWRLFAGAFIILFTLREMKSQITNSVKSQGHLKKWREWRAKQLEEDLEFCHPRWPQEIKYVQTEIKAIRNLSLISSSDWWIYFDWVALVLILACITTHVLFFVYDTDAMKELHHHTMIPLLMVLWFRIFKYARPFESAGPFVVIFGSVMGDILKWFVLNSVIVIPFTCAFWITFGAVSLHPVTGYETVGSLCYNMFSMMVVGDHNFKGLVEVNPILARLLCGSFIGLAAIVTVNLLIALLSNTFERLHENAVANAVMQRARTILWQEKSLRSKQKQNYYNLVRKKGSPEIVQNKQGRVCSPAVEERATIERVYDSVKNINIVLNKRFGKSYGKEQKSDLDCIEDDLKYVKEQEETLVKDVKEIKLILHHITKKLFGQSPGSYSHLDEEDDNHSDGTANSNLNSNHIEPEINSEVVLPVSGSTNSQSVVGSGSQGRKLRKKERNLYEDSDSMSEFHPPQAYGNTYYQKDANQPYIRIFDDSQMRGKAQFQHPKHAASEVPRLYSQHLDDTISEASIPVKMSHSALPVIHDRRVSMPAAVQAYQPENTGYWPNNTAKVQTPGHLPYYLGHRSHSQPNNPHASKHGSQIRERSNSQPWDRNQEITRPRHPAVQLENSRQNLEPIIYPKDQRVSSPFPMELIENEGATNLMGNETAFFPLASVLENRYYEVNKNDKDREKSGGMVSLVFEDQEDNAEALRERKGI